MNRLEIYPSRGVLAMHVNVLGDDSILDMDRFNNDVEPSDELRAVMNIEFIKMMLYSSTERVRWALSREIIPVITTKINKDKTGLKNAALKSPLRVEYRTGMLENDAASEYITGYADSLRAVFLLNRALMAGKLDNEEPLLQEKLTKLIREFSEKVSTLTTLEGRNVRLTDWASNQNRDLRNPDDFIEFVMSLKNDKDLVKQLKDIVDPILDEIEKVMNDAKKLESEPRVVISASLERYEELHVLTSKKDVTAEELGIEVINTGLTIAEDRPLVFSFDLHGTLLKADWKSRYLEVYWNLIGSEPSKSWVEDHIAYKGYSDEHYVGAMLDLVEIKEKGITEAEIRIMIASVVANNKLASFPEAIPGALEFIKRLHDLKIPVIIVSNSPVDVVLRQLTARGFTKYLDKNLIFGNDLNGKILKKAVKRYFNGRTLLHFDDTKFRRAVVGDMGGVYMGYPHGKPGSRELNKNRARHFGVNTDILYYNLSESTQDSILYMIKNKTLALSRQRGIRLRLSGLFSRVINVIRPYEQNLLNRPQVESDIIDVKTEFQEMFNAVLEKKGISEFLVADMTKFIAKDRLMVLDLRLTEKLLEIGYIDPGLASDLFEMIVLREMNQNNNNELNIDEFVGKLSTDIESHTALAMMLWYDIFLMKKLSNKSFIRRYVNRKLGSFASFEDIYNVLTEVIAINEKFLGRKRVIDAAKTRGVISPEKAKKLKDRAGFVEKWVNVVRNLRNVMRSIALIPSAVAITTDYDGIGPYLLGKRRVKSLIDIMKEQLDLIFGNTVNPENNIIDDLRVYSRMFRAT